jgi:hypothetical protein
VRLQPLRDDYGKDVDGVNWDILNPGNRTNSGSGATMTGAAATERGQDLPLWQRIWLGRLWIVFKLIVDPHLVPGSTENPANMTNRDYWSCIWPWMRVVMPLSIGEEPTPMKPLESKSCDSIQRTEDVKPV